MIDSSVLARILYSKYIPHVLYDTDDGGVTLGIGAYRAELSVTDIVALLAVDDAVTHLY